MTPRERDELLQALIQNANGTHEFASWLVGLTARVEECERRLQEWIGQSAAGRRVVTTDTPPADFESWEQCRAYWSLEALFRGQQYDSVKTASAKRRYREAARLATEANARCADPYEDEDAD